MSIRLRCAAVALSIATIATIAMLEPTSPASAGTVAPDAQTVGPASVPAE